jgi:penicillin-binding protein 1A
MKNQKIDWLSEIKKAGRFAARGFLKFLQVFANVLITIILIGVLTGVIVVSAFSIYIGNYIETEADMSFFKLNISSTTTRIFYYEFDDRTGRVGEAIELEDQRLQGDKDSIYVKYENIPENMINAVIAIEDKRFRTHDGVDWKRTIAAGANFFLGFAESGYGGSSITQQLVKNMTHEDDYTIQRKVTEIFWALDIEQKMEKEEILELYLNVVNFGNGSSGVQAAAYNYFSKDVSELTLIECAAIAGITKNPSLYNPLIHPEQNAIRRNTVLGEMLDQGLITQREFDEAYGKELVTRPPVTKETAVVNSWYTDMAIQDVIDDLVEQKGYSPKVASLMVYNGGLNIYMLVDPELQTLLEEEFTDSSNFPTATSGLKAQSAGIVIDPETGDVLAVVGSRDKKTANRIQNYATQTKRSPGSSIKPLAVYAPAIEHGIANYASVYDDSPFKFYNNKSAWPQNASRNYRGLTTLWYGVSRSLNSIAVKVLDEVGLERAFRFCHDTVGIESLIERKRLESGTVLSDKDYAALALGQLNYGLTVRELTAAYSIFANDGIYNSPNSYLKVTDSYGEVVLENKYSGTVAISQETATIMNKILRTVITEGTASSYTDFEKLGVDFGAKTGTAGENYDRWIVGYTPYYICGVWYGHEYPKALSGLKTNPAVDLWDVVMKQAHKKHLDAAKAGTTPLKTFNESDDIVTALYCKDSGKLVAEACAHDPRGNRAETGYFIKGTEPTTYCDTHVLVDYDVVTGGVACEWCPPENIMKTALIKVDRLFPVQVYITDAEYTYFELPYDVRPYNGEKYSYYYNLCGKGHYFGRSKNTPPYNKACYQHFDEDAWRQKLNEMNGGTPAAPFATALPFAFSNLWGF